MFRIKYPVGNVIKRVFQGSLKPLDEVPMNVSESGLLIRALSPDKNLMVEINIPQTAFEEFEVDKETSIVVERTSFLRVFRRSTRRDSVVMMYEDGSRDLKVILINTKSGAERSYSVDVREVGVELIGSINVDLSVKFQIDSDEFRKIIRDAKLINEHLELIYSEGRIEVRSTSENKAFRQVLMLDKPLYILESRESHVSCRYDLDLLKTIATSLTVGDVVTVEYGASLPLKMTLNLSDGTIINYWIAPRI